MVTRLRPQSSRGLLPAALAIFLAWGCGGDDNNTGPDARTIEFDRSAMLENIGEKIVLATYRDFDTEADQLVIAVDAYCQALGTGGELDELVAVQSQWRTTMVAWQIAESMLFGPAAMDSQALRDRIYSWPVTSGCAVDQDVVLNRDDANYDISSRVTNRRGLDALEYVLLAPTLDTVCPPQTAPEGWDALPDGDRLVARCEFARVAAGDLAAQAQLAVDAWDPAAGNYLAELTGAGQSGSSFDSAQDAVNVVSDAMFYVDSHVKDMKLGEPAGIVINRCSSVQTPCLEELESLYASHSAQNIVANLEGLQMLYTGGGDGLGFEDFLRAAGARDLADSMRDDIAAAVTAARAIPIPMSDALSTDYDKVTAAHAAVRKVTDNLKSQFLTVLGLEIPDDAAADND